MIADVSVVQQVCNMHAVLFVTFLREFLVRLLLDNSEDDALDRDANSELRRRMALDFTLLPHFIDIH